MKKFTKSTFNFFARKVLLLFLCCVIHLSNANSPDLGGFTCANFVVNGPRVTCLSDNEATYQVNFSNFQTITWSVTTGLMSIKTVGGLSLMNLIRESGLTPVNPNEVPQITQIFVQEHIEKISFNMGFEFGDTTFAANAFIDFTKVPALKNFFSNRRVNGQSIVVSLLRPGRGQVYASATDVKGDAPVVGGLFTCYSVENDTRSVEIRGALLPEIGELEFSSNMSLNSVQCGQHVNMYVPYFQNTGGINYTWSSEPVSTIINSNQSSANFHFPEADRYVISLRITDACGNARVYSRTVTVTVQESHLRIDGQELSSNTIDVDCNRAKGFNMSVEPWLSNTSDYEWVLPAGWRIQGRSPSTVNYSNGVAQYSYEGNNMRYVRIEQFTPNAEPGTMVVRIRNTCGTRSAQFLRAYLQTPEPISVQFDDNMISCVSRMDLNPIVSGGVPPYKLNWSSTGLSGVFENGNSYTDAIIQNAYIAQRFGNGTITVNVEDSRGCTNRATTNVAIFGGNDPENMDISGWLSGHINPNVPATVASNLAYSESGNRLYFVRNINGARQMFYYYFNTATGKWALNAVNTGALLASGDNAVRYLRTVGAYDYLFYVNSAGFLEVALIDRSTGNVAAENLKFSLPIEPRENTQAYAYTIEDVNGSLVNILWKDMFGNLYIQRAVFDLGVSTPDVYLDLNSFRTVASAYDHGYNGVVRYDMNKERNRIFYFRANGGFYTKHLDDLDNEVRINGVLDNDQVWNITDLVFDNESNVYFVANGDLFFAEFDVNEDYLGLYKIETTEGVLTDQLKSGAKGYLAINKTTNVLYYAGYNNNIYQVYRDNQFDQNKLFHIVKATPEAFYDQADNGLVFSAGRHLFYRSNDQQVYNLFYIDVAQLAECKPKWMRQSEIVEELVEARLIDSPSSKEHLNGQIFPNPASETITVDVWGNINSEGYVKIYDLQGNEVTAKQYDFTPQIIDVEHLVIGMYVVYVTDGEKTLTLKLIKQ